MKEHVQHIQGRIREVAQSPLFLLLPTLISLAGILLGEGALVPCILINGELFALLLLACADWSAVLMCLMGVLLDGTAFVGRWDVFLPLILSFGAPIIAVLVYDICRRMRKPFFVGAGFLSYLAVSVAVALGGLFSLSWTELMTEGGLYHTLALSLGLVVLYLLLGQDLKGKDSTRLIRHFLWCMLFVGLLCCAVTLKNITTHEGLGAYITAYSHRNTIANLLLMALPVPFFFARDTKCLYGKLFCFLLGCGFYVSLILTAARTGWIFGTVLFLLCLAWYFYGKGDWVGKAICLACLLVGICVLGSARPFWDALFDLRKVGGHLISPEEGRAVLLMASFRDFCRHPLFGIGLAATANTAAAGQPMGCIPWYHSYVPQVFGSLGLCGCFAYLYQGWIRVRFLSFRPDRPSFAIGMCYLGLFLYSQTDPGEFIPIPFALLAVWIFLLLEGRYEEKKGISQSLWLPKAEIHAKKTACSLPQGCFLWE